MKNVVRALLVLALVIALVAVGVFVWAERKIGTASAPPGAPTIEFTVQKGASARSLGPQLVANGLISDTFAWRWFLVRRGGVQVNAGRFALSPSMTVEEIGTALGGAPLPEDIPFVIIEGWRIRDTDAALAADGLIQAGEYTAAASDPSQFTAPFPLPPTSLEGYLYPETYRIHPGDLDVKALIQRQLDAFAERFYLPNREAISQSGRTLHELVVMASMLEREEPLPTQRPLVAGILWKRIDRGYPLGVDATSRYELQEWNDRRAFLKRLRDKQDPWNTRHKRGLPPGPIGAPTVASLQAALSPERSEYWYYLHDGDRILRPSRNAQEHEALRKKYDVY